MHFPACQRKGVGIAATNVDNIEVVIGDSPSSCYASWVAAAFICVCSSELSNCDALVNEISGVVAIPIRLPSQYSISWDEQ